MNTHLKAESWIARAIAPLIVLTILLIGLPILGAGSAGHPISMYLEFPPHTRYIQHAPFSWPVFTSLSICAVSALGVFVFLYFPARRQTDRFDIGRHLPWWGWLAGWFVLMLWALAWTRFSWFEPLQSFTFTPLWISYIVFVNALTYRRRGECLLTHRPRYLLALFPASSLFWWYFEYLNRFAQNWYYSGQESFSPTGYVVHGTIAFSTVLPAVMSTSELLQSHPALRQTRFRKSVSLNNSKIQAGTILIVASCGLVCVAIWPDGWYPVLWLSPFLILVSVQILLGQPTILQELERGDWSALTLPALAALICGFFWEMWNYYSYPKWVYSIPYVQRFQIFEMPLLGYFGYLPFGLQCGAVADLVARLAQSANRNSRVGRLNVAER